MIQTQIKKSGVKLSNQFSTRRKKGNRKAWKFIEQIEIEDQIATITTTNYIYKCMEKSDGGH